MRLKGEEVEFTAERKAEVDRQLSVLMNKVRGGGKTVLCVVHVCVVLCGAGVILTSLSPLLLSLPFFSLSPSSPPPSSPLLLLLSLHLFSTSLQGRRCLAMAELILDPKVYDEKFEFDIQGAFYNFPMGEPRDAEEAVNSLQMSGGALGIIDYNEAAKAEGRPLKPEVCMEKLCFLGFMALIDPPRAAVPGAVAKCKVRAERGGNKNTVLCAVLCAALCGVL
jgi:hypothetical protein